MTLSALCIGTSVGSSEPSKDQINKNGLAEVSKWVRAFKIILLVYIKLHDLCLQDEVRKIILSRIFYWILNVELPNKIYFVNLTWFKKLSHADCTYLYWGYYHHHHPSPKTLVNPPKPVIHPITETKVLCNVAIVHPYHFVHILHEIATIIC